MYVCWPTFGIYFLQESIAKIRATYIRTIRSIRMYLRTSVRIQGTYVYYDRIKKLRRKF